MPRLVINKEAVRTFKENPIIKNGKIVDTSAYRNTQMFRFGHLLNTRDVLLNGDLQDEVDNLVVACGWKDQFDSIVPPDAPPIRTD